METVHAPEVVAAGYGVVTGKVKLICIVGLGVVKCRHAVHLGALQLYKRVEMISVSIIL